MPFLFFQAKLPAEGQEFGSTRANRRAWLAHHTGGHDRTATAIDGAPRSEVVPCREKRKMKEIFRAGATSLFPRAAVPPGGYPPPLAFPPGRNSCAMNRQRPPHPAHRRAARPCTHTAPLESWQRLAASVNAAPQSPRQPAGRAPSQRARRMPALPALSHVLQKRHRSVVSATRLENQARCANRCEPRSSLACPRPATSPLRACPPPLAFVAPRQHRTGLPAGVCRRRNTAAALRARRARGVATHRAGALPRRAERMAALRASAGVKRAFPPRARPERGALGRLARSLN